MSRGVLGLILVAFASGAATGYLVAADPFTPRYVRGSKAFVEELAREVRVTPEQRARIEKIVEKNHARVVPIRAKAELDVATIRSESRAEIRELLEPEQRVRFEDYTKRRDAMREGAQQRPQ